MDVVGYIAEAIGWLLLIDFIWASLEILLYGETRPSIRDFIIGSILSNVIMYYKYFN